MNLFRYLILAGALFAIDAVTVLMRRPAIIPLMGVEFVLSSVNLVFVTFARILGDANGEIMAFFVMTVATAEAVAGFAVVVSISKLRSTASVDDVNLPKN